MLPESHIPRETLESLGCYFAVVNENQEFCYFSEPCVSLFRASSAVDLLKSDELKPLISQIITLSSEQGAKEVDVQKADGTRIPLLLQVALTPPACTLRYASFYDLSSYEPLFRLVEQMRKNRAVFVLASSLLGKNMLFDNTSGDVISAYQSIETAFFKHHPDRDENLTETDLLAGVSKAVDIIDSLILPSTRVRVDVRLPVLLAISLPNFLRILSHVLLEAADFTAVHGTCTIEAALVHDLDSAKCLHLNVTAAREYELPKILLPLEHYLYKRFLPCSASHAVYSENFAIAKHLAEKCGIPLEAQQSTNAQLKISLRFKLKE